MSLRPRSRTGRWGWRLFLFLFTLYVIGGCYYGYVFVSQVQVFLANPVSAEPASEPTLVQPPMAPTPRIVEIGPQPTSRAAPTPPRAAEIAGTFAGTQRINILLMGLDQREDTKDWDPGRTDTMIVATIDPYAKTATLLTLPRDLWVVIPTKRYGNIDQKITGAHTYGGLEGYPDGSDPLGGPKLAKKTVELNFGIPIHYWARIDLHGFEQAVDMLGGVWVDVEKPIVDDEYPTDDYGVMSIYIPAGRQLMDGRTALQFARSRHSGNDIERGNRQRQVLLALRQQAVQVDMLRRLPELIDLFQDHFVTDMPVEQAVRLATIMRDIPPGNVKSRSLDANYVLDWRTPTGELALLPLRDKIAGLIKELFYTDSRLSAEGARVAVRNGAGREGLAGAWSKYLKDQDFDVVLFGDADRNDYRETVIIDHTANGGKSYTIDTLRRLLGTLPSNRVRREPNANATSDIEVILGLDAPAR